MINDPSLSCTDEWRRERVRERNLNGIDYLEVSDDQRTLTIFFLGKAPLDITRENVVISGGRRITGLKVVALTLCIIDDEDRDDCMKIVVDRPGDFSTYRLCLVATDELGSPTDKPLAGFDPRYSCIEFSFKIGCPSDLDCAGPAACPPVPPDEPEINYLAKDYASFRQLMLDRLALVMPDWKERHIPDLGITLVELLAYAGDHLSYYQDAVATEAYLETARQRISVRRHARLVDYHLHEGCNARAWVSLETSGIPGTLELDPRELYFITTSTEPALAPEKTILTSDDLRNPTIGSYEVFEPMTEKPGDLIRVREAHNEIQLYTWGDAECCLAKGATSATLLDGWEIVPGGGDPTQRPGKNVPSGYDDDGTGSRGRRLDLRVGDVLIFEEVIGPKTGVEADADRSHRQAVRLTRVEPAVDELYDQPIVGIEWSDADALGFPLCVSAIGPAPECKAITGISVAVGNIVLVDHGRTLPAEELGNVPVASTTMTCEAEGRPSEITLIAGRFAPHLSKTPLTHAGPIAPGIPASATLAQDPARAIPAIDLRAIPGSPDGSGALFAWSDIIDPTLIARKLHSPEDPVVQPLFNQLSARTRALLDMYNGPIAYELQTALRADLKALPKLPNWVDINNPTLTAKKLHEARRSMLAAQALLGLLSSETRALIEAYDGSKPLPDELHAALTTDLLGLVRHWTPRLDLLESDGDDAGFVVEIDNEGLPHLRFGDGELGERPEVGTGFNAVYRVGNGPAGNVGAETITRIVLRRMKLDGITITPSNPLPAHGGIAPESLAEARLRAPQTFRSELRRAITADDYALLAGRDEKIQRAAGSLRWNGSWYEVQVAVDPRMTDEPSPAIVEEVNGLLYPYGRIGYDLKVSQGRYVPLRIELAVCVAPHYLRAHVKAALLDLFSNRRRADGTPGFFHPDNLSFGDNIHLSRIVSAALGVTGVESVVVNKLERLFERPNGEIADGLLTLGALEIARLGNDPGNPENGQLTLIMRGGR
jgi:hypothetical protein